MFDLAKLKEVIAFHTLRAQFSLWHFKIFVPGIYSVADLGQRENKVPGHLFSTMGSFCHGQDLKELKSVRRQNFDQGRDVIQAGF